MKKLLSIIMATLLVAVAFAGCTTKTSGGDVPTLVWYVPGDSQNDMTTVMKVANEIIEPAIGARLELKMIDLGSYAEKMSLMMAAQEEFDICFTGYVNTYKSAVNMGAYIELTDLIEKEAPKLKEVIPDFAFAGAYEQGGIYAIPNYQVMVENPGVFFFKEYADKYGIKEGMTYNELSDLEPYLEAIKNGEKNIFPITKLPDSFQNKGYIRIKESPAFYINTNDKKVKVYSFEELPEYKTRIDTARKWYENGYLRSDIDTAAMNMTDDLRAGKYAAFTATTWKPGIEQDHKKQYGKETVFVGCGNALLNSGRNAMTAISATSRHPEKAIKLLELVNTDKELYNIICYGVEGKHYEKLEGDYIRTIEGSGYSQLACWKFGNQFNAFLLEGQAADVWEKTKEFNAAAQVSPISGFTIDENPVKNEIAQTKAIVSEYSALEYGSMSNYEKLFEKYVERINTAGNRAVVKEIQKQIDEWIKINKK